MNEERGLVLTLSAVRETAAREGEDPTVAAQFVHFITVEKVAVEQLQLVTLIPKEQPTPDEGPAGTNKGTGGGSKPKPEKPGGGGGGGRENPLPVSYGKVAPASMNPQIMPPSVRVPAITQPKLPVAATLKGDPLLLPEDTRPIPFGDPKSTSTIPSDGPGKGGGQGTGTGTGQGPGDGAGYGPGRGENVGGGDARYGGGGPGGGGGGAPPVDYNRVFSPEGRDEQGRHHLEARPRLHRGGAQEQRDRRRPAARGALGGRRGDEHRRRQGSARRPDRARHRGGAEHQVPPRAEGRSQRLAAHHARIQLQHLLTRRVRERCFDRAAAPTRGSRFLLGGRRSYT